MTQTTKAQPPRLAYISFIQCICAVAVVFLHTNGFWGYSDSAYWRAANVVESLFYFAVPVFYMLSGAMLMDFSEKYSLREYFVRRAKKTLLPFLFWSLLIILFKFVSGQIGFSDLHPVRLIRDIFGTKYLSIFYFFPVIFCLYLCMPLFSAVEKQKRKKLFTYLLVVGFIFNSLIPYIPTLSGYSAESTVTVSVISESLWYAVCGYMLVTYPPKRSIRILLYLLALAVFLVFCVGTYFASLKAGTVAMTFKGYYTPLCYIYAMGVFVLLQQVGKKIAEKKISGFFMWLGKYTMAIYLLHYFVMMITRKLIGLGFFPIIYSLLEPLWIIPICVLITIVVRKIPLIRRVLPE